MKTLHGNDAGFNCKTVLKAGTNYRFNVAVQHAQAAFSNARLILSI